MNDILYTAAQLVVMVLSAVIARYVIPWLKGKIGQQKMAQIASWAVWAVDWAEQIITAPSAGDRRKELVMGFLQDMLEQVHIEMTDEQLEVLIESAVRQMHMLEMTQPDDTEPAAQ